MNTKTQILSILILAILLINIDCKFAKHFQRYNDQLYANQLLKRQTQYQNQMKNISQQVLDLDQIISKYQGNDTYQLMKLQQGLADQRDSLYDIQRTLNQPFALKPCQKPNFTQEEKTQINNQIKSANDSLISLTISLSKCTMSIGQCTMTNQLIDQITRTKIYLDVMNDYINGNCQRVPRQIQEQKALGLVDLNDRLYKDNLKAPNWVYGNITEEQYRLMVFSQTTKFNMTTCPIQTPFSNKVNNTCFLCPQGSVFSLGQRVCTCPKDYKFDSQTNQCVSLFPIRPCNQTGTCVSLCPKDKPRWNSVNKICQKCPDNLPIVNKQTQACQTCPLKTPVWNQITYQCQQCPLNNQYVQGKCIPCKDDQKFDQKVYKCVPLCQIGQIYNKQQGKCYTNQQLNGCKCNQKYNTVTKQCEDVCQNGLQWISKDQKCGPPTIPIFKDQCKYYQRPNAETGQCQNYCDNTVAWYDRINHVCIRIGCGVQCKCKQIFDTVTGKCIPQGTICPQGKFFNGTTQKCQIKCIQGLLYNQKTQSCQPPLKNCLVDQILNITTNTCVKKCNILNHVIYNTQTNKCQCQPNYIPSSNDSNICVSVDIMCSKQNNLVYNSQLKKCQCMELYHYDNSTQTCVKNPIQCDRKKQFIYNKQSGKCICRQGFILTGQGVCVSVCLPSTNMTYNYTTHSCVCKVDHYLSPDAKYCLHISAKCLTANNMFYNATIKNCQCNLGFYLINGACIPQNSKCNENLHFILNPTTKQCECQKGYKLSLGKVSCVSIVELCLKNPNTFYNNQTNKCQCLLGFNLVSQLEDNMTCVSRCKVDQKYNPITNLCQALCPSSYFYNLTTHSCISRCPADYQYNILTQKCQKTIKVCPDPNNQFLDPTTNQCKYCPTGYSLNRTTLICQKFVPTCLKDQFYNQATNLCEYCRQGLIYNVTSKKCQFKNVTCASGQYFDYQTGKCKVCGTNQMFDSNIYGCRAICNADQIYDYVAKNCVLISKTCASHQYYDSNTKKCVNKPYCSSIQRYDQLTRTCVNIPYITSKNAKNVIHENYTQWVIEYDAKKAQDKYLTDCPVQSPFYSTLIKSCVYCPSTHPYYNLKTEKCQNCPGMVYDSNLKRCIVQPSPINNTTIQATPNLDYSLDRLVMNII